MGKFNFKNRIFVGPIDNMGTQKALNVEGVVTSDILPGSAVRVSSTDIVAAVAADVHYVGAALQEVPSSEGGSVDTVIESGTYASSIQPRSGDFLNLLFLAGETIVRGETATVSADTAGLHVVSTVAGSGLYVVQEDLGVLSEDTLVRCRFK